MPRTIAWTEQATQSFNTLCWDVASKSDIRRGIEKYATKQEWVAVGQVWQPVQCTYNGRGQHLIWRIKVGMFRVFVTREMNKAIILDVVERDNKTYSPETLITALREAKR